MDLKRRNGKAGQAMVRILLIAVVPMLAIRRQWHKQQKSQDSLEIKDEDVGNLKIMMQSIILALKSITWKEALPSIILLSVLGIMTILVVIGHVFKSRIDQHEMYDFLYQDKSVTLHDIMDELDSYLQNPQASPKLFGDSTRRVAVQCLSAMSKRYNAKKTPSKKTRTDFKTKSFQDEQLCFDAALLVLQNFPLDDEAVAASLSLFALVAKTEIMSSLMLQSSSNKQIPLKRCLKAMTESLERTKSTTAAIKSNTKLPSTEPNKQAKYTEYQERLAAELQRKGCLLLGALADDRPGVAAEVVSEGGLDTIMEAMDWFRLHQDLCNWALWSLFVLCYNHVKNKHLLIQQGGLERICRVMKDIPESMEVQRHGVAILFDVLRDSGSNEVQGVAKLRVIALNAGLHDALVVAMTHHSKNVEIHMMSRQMLAATGYQGVVPVFNGKLPLQQSKKIHT